LFVVKKKPVILQVKNTGH